MKLLYTAVALALYATSALAESVYAYPCWDCKCNAQHSFGAGSFGDCIDLPDSWSMGLSRTGLGTESVRCTVFPNYGCQGSSQNMGVHSGESWGCTNTQISWIRSAVCDIAP